MRKAAPKHQPYYSINMKPREKQKFLYLVRKELAKKNMSIYGLADAIGRPRKTVYNFFGGETKPLKFVAAEIANYFGLCRSDWMWFQLDSEGNVIEDENGNPII